MFLKCIFSVPFPSWYYRLTGDKMLIEQCQAEIFVHLLYLCLLVASLINVFFFFNLNIFMYILSCLHSCLHTRKGHQISL